jgi:PAS domain S-box-containing protein
MLGTVGDITERKRAEEALKQSEERFRSLFQNSADIVVILDVNGLVSYDTPSFSRILGYPHGHLLGRNPLDLIHPDDVEKVALDLGDVYQNRNDGTPTEFRFRKADGTWIFLEAIGNNLQDYPGINGLVITARDITERKKAEDLRFEMERRLLHAQRLESLGVMAGGIAHDFNNLLMAILGNLDLAQLDLTPVSRSRPFIDHAMVAARRAADLTNQMLAYSGKGRFDLKTFDLSELVEEMSHLLKASISKTVTLNLQTARDLPSIKADPGQIQQIIMNLIVNASEAIGDAPGVVTITTDSLECMEDCLKQSLLKDKPETGTYVLLEVKDTGCGMDKETMDRLFDPFFTTKFTGRGLGLAAVSGIITGHKGAIMVDSEPGRGTAIRVLLPVSGDPPVKTLRESANTKAKDSGGNSEPVPAGTVLVVDDEEMVRDLCRSMVERLGYAVITASDGEEAVRIFREKAADIVCVILDLTMPRKDGLDTFDELKHMNERVRVILSSGFNEQETTHRFLGKGLAGFIKKPYRLENLRMELERVLGDS